MSTESKFRKFLESYRGKTLFNYFYGFGASIAILGTLFKILHLDGANVMLAVGLGTEVLMFFISAFEPPFRAYHWEEVFPVLKTRNPEDRPSFGSAIINGPMPQGAEEQPVIIENTVPAAVQTPKVAVSSAAPQTVQPVNAAEMASVAAAATQAAAAAQAAMANMPAGQAANGAQGSFIAGQVAPGNFPSFSSIPEAYGFPPQVHLSEEESKTLENSLKGYIEQMDALNLNLRGLNTIYEIQLKSISSQIDTIDRVNKGLVHIKDMYEGSAADSERFQTETEQMASNLANLNQIYARMLQAMMPQMPMGAMSKAFQSTEATETSTDGQTVQNQ